MVFMKSTDVFVLCVLLRISAGADKANAHLLSDVPNLGYVLIIVILGY